MKNATVEQVHREFNTAGEKLLKQAKAILSSGKLDNPNIEKLKSLGFKECREVAVFDALSKKIENAKLCEHYQISYPLNKFITLESVNKICKKYGLLFADVTQYKGSIPNKNIKEIISFIPNDSDLDENSIYDSMFSFTFWVSPGREVKKEPEPKDNLNRKLKICASKKMLKTEGMKVVGNELVVKDPVVLHPVKGGYLIVSAWGNEASDEYVVNEKFN